ncbi:MAG: ABC transporter permease [Alishewanella sp.]|nr:ABC transporter permease [Alishewanella sp.]
MASLMNEIKLILRTHMAYFKHHPWLLLLFIVGLSLGSALLTAIAGLNQEAKNRHQISAALIDNTVSHMVKPPIGQAFLDGALWLKLRANGYTNAQPVLRGQLQLSSGHTLYLQGVDSLMWLTQSAALSTQQHAETTEASFRFDNIIIDSNNAAKLMLDSESRQLTLQDSVIKPSFTLAADIGVWSVTDLAYADMLLNANGQLSFIELIDLAPEQAPLVEAILGNDARLVAAQEQDFDALSEAFFFNLGALALLGYIVAAFLSFNAIKLSIAGRRNLLIQFHVLGFSQQAIFIAIAIEFIVMGFLTALLGSLAGYIIANTLLMDINSTLMGLYQLEKALTLSWQWQTLLLGFLLNIVTLGLMLLTQKKVLHSHRKGLFYIVLGGVLAALSYGYFYASTEFDALLMCFLILVVFVLITPSCLQGLLSVKNPFSQPLWQWLYADSKFQLAELRIAIVAILVALGSAIGMQIMVKSFSDTLNAHLETQLNADIYLQVDDDDPALRQRLAMDTQVARVGIYMAAAGYIDKTPTRLISYGDGDEAFSHISLTSNQPVSAENFAEQGCIANEQAAIKEGYKINDRVRFVQNQHEFACRISAFAYDYGNTALSLIIQEQTLRASPFHWQVFGLSLTLAEQVSVEQITERLINVYQLDSATIAANKHFKAVANKMFNETFQVTKLLNGFILAIALLSLCISLLSLSALHVSQLAVLHSLGVDAAQLQKLKLLQTTLLVFFTCAFAIPLGFALGFTLLEFVMPIAFGWTIHFNLDLPALLYTCLFMLLAAVLCAYLPIKKLTAHLQVKGP